MDQIPIFRVEKLAGTIEELELDQRVYHVLKRAGIHHVSSIISRGEVSILNLKNMGVVSGSHVFSAAANYLNIPKEELFSEEIIQAAIFYEERPFDPLESSITILDVSFSTIKSLNSLGVFTIGDLLKLKIDAEDGYGIGDLRKSEVYRIFNELSLYLSRTNQISTEQTSSKPTIRPSIIDLSTILAALLMNERTSRIVELRANKLLTLEEIATEVGGVTRQRIRQIIYKVLERVRVNLDLFTLFCDFFEEKAESIGKKTESEILSISALVKQFKFQLSDSSLLSATEKELEILIAIIRLLVINEKPWIQEILKNRWKTFAYLASSTNPPIVKHEPVNQFLKQEKERNKKASYKELALLILVNEKSLCIGRQLRIVLIIWDVVIRLIQLRFTIL
jgi:hypothetical protein